MEALYKLAESYWWWRHLCYGLACSPCLHPQNRVPVHAWRHGDEGRAGLCQSWAEGLGLPTTYLCSSTNARLSLIMRLCSTAGKTWKCGCGLVALPSADSTAAAHVATLGLVARSTQEGCSEASKAVPKLRLCVKNTELGLCSPREAESHAMLQWCREVELDARSVSQLAQSADRWGRSWSVSTIKTGREQSWRRTPVHVCCLVCIQTSLLPKHMHRLEGRLGPPGTC